MTTTCTNCGEACGADDVFCEACGFDFITGTMPAGGQGEGAMGGAAGASAEASRPPSLVTSSPERPGVVLEVSVDRGYFDEVVTEGEIEFPDPVPEVRRLELSGSELHIGRTSESRAVHPDIDVAALTGDPAVSTRHAVMRIDHNGSISVLDVGSTNGTFLTAPDSVAIAPGETVALALGTPIYVGAWTRLAVVEVMAQAGSPVVGA